MTRVAQNGIALDVLLPEEEVIVRLFGIFSARHQYLLQITRNYVNLLCDLRRWGRLHLFILAVGTCLDIGEVFTDVLGQMVGTGIPFV